MKESLNRINLCFELIHIYEDAIKKFLKEQNIKDEEAEHIVNSLNFQRDIIFSLNKRYKQGHSFSDFCSENKLSSQLENMFKINYPLYVQQENAIKSILQGKSTVISTGTGSGKTEAFLIPIVDYCLKNNDKKGVKALIIYPMNALAGDQLKRIEEVIRNSGISYALISGENNIENGEEASRNKIVKDQPDILITNYVMLDRVLVNNEYRKIFANCKNIFKYIVLDEIHSYSGNKALHIRFLLSRLKYIVGGNVIQIGCSATLKRDKQLKNTQELLTSEVRQFIENIFDLKSTKEHQYIEPVYEDITKTNYEVEDENYKAVQKDYKTQLIKNALNEECKTLDEILEALKSNKVKITREELKEYFKKVLELNEKYKEKPILDFRIHIFFMGMNNVLRRCTNCGEYYTTNIKRCNDCGYLILPVYKKDTNLLIGVLKDGKIRDPFSYKIGDEDPLVLINFNKENKTYKNLHKLNFNFYENKKDSLYLDIEKEGKYEIYYSPELNKDNLRESVIQISSNTGDIFLYQLIKNTMLSLENNKRKILAFIDNREKVGRYATTIGDMFLSDFYYEVLSFINRGENFNLKELEKETKNSLIDSLGEFKDISDDNKSVIIHDFNIWFRRVLMLNDYKSFHESMKISLIDKVKLSELEEIILNVAILEGIFFSENLYENCNIIRLQQNRFQRSKGFSFRSIKNVNTIVFSSLALKYSDLINKYGLDNIKLAFKKLTDKGILIVKDYDNGEKNIEKAFYLNVRKIKLITKKSEYNSINEILREHILFAGTHSSEVDKKVRKENEDKFSKSKLNLLFATPTLEMGIDIGDLSYVFMLGVPPSPSNYAQRAGRAGRKGDRFAGIITICYETSNHDWDYFHNPKKMIEGTINPPKFNLNNVKVLNKHVNTLIYPELKNNVTSNIPYQKKKQLKYLCERVFNMDIDIEEHIEMLSKSLSNKFNLTYNDLYEIGIYPDYSFRKDEIKLVNYTLKKERYVIASREPEQAYKDLIPGTELFIGQKYYYIFTQENKKTFESIDGKVVIECTEIDCMDNEKNIKMDREYVPKEAYVITCPNLNISKKYNKGPVNMYLQKNLDLQFISVSLNNFEAYPLGYRMTRDSILVEIDSLVVNEEQSVSFIALLYKVIIEEMGIDENELGLIMNDDLRVPNLQEDNKHYFILYDKTGFGNVDMKLILELLNIQEPNNLLRKVYNRLINCNCRKSSGCYSCIKTYKTSMFSSKINKDETENFLGYLIGKNKFKVFINEIIEILNYELVMEIKQSGSNFIININGKENKIEKGSSQNITIMSEIYRKLKYLYENDDIETVKIKSPLEYLVNAVNEKGSLKDCTEEFKLFKFYKMAYKKVLGEKVEKK